MTLRRRLSPGLPFAEPSTVFDTNSQIEVQLAAKYMDAMCDCYRQ